MHLPSVFSLSALFLPPSDIANGIQPSTAYHAEDMKQHQAGHGEGRSAMRGDDQWESKVIGMLMLECMNRILREMHVGNQDDDSMMLKLSMPSIAESHGISEKL
jgi:hypothetical protein